MPQASEPSLIGSPAYRAARGLTPGQTAAPSSPAGAFLAARAHFLAGDRLDMRALAAELGVSRPTLYRWTGPREQLLGDVLFALSDVEFARACVKASELSGPERLLAVFRGHVGAIVASPAVARFVRAETQVALRVLTARDGPVNPRTVRRIAEFYGAEQAAGRFDPPADVETLAFAVVCLTERFIYNDARHALEDEVERAAAVVALLLGA